MQITVVYPAFNEEHSIRQTVLRSLDALRGLFSSFEVLVVNDGSRDSTGELADGLAREFPTQVRVLHNPRNLGQGASIINGMRDARGELVLHNGIDYPFDLNDLAKMLPLLERADIVVAARKARPGYSAYRKLASVTNIALIHLLFDVHLRDYNFVQLYRKEVWQRVPIESRSTAFLTPGLLIRAHDMGYRLAEVEVDYHARERGVATAGSPRVVLASIREMLAFWWQRHQQRGHRQSVPAGSNSQGAGK